MVATGRHLVGKVALVTGASRGIGLAAARQLAADGAHVILAARDAEGCRQAANRLNSAGLSASAVALDVVDNASAADVAAAIEASHGRLDIVINNAGILGPLSSVASSDPTAWHSAILVNLLGPYNVCREVLALMSPGGTIINVSSSAADAPVDKMSAYCCSKAGLTMFTRALAEECSLSGITVLGFRPGRVNTGMHTSLRTASANSLSKIDPAMLAPTDRPARAISLLCGPQGKIYHGKEVDITSLL